MAKRREVIGVITLALGGCATRPGDDGAEADTDPGNNTATPTPTEVGETRTPPPTDTEALEDLAINNRRAELVTGTITIDTNDESEILEFELKNQEDKVWEQVPVLRSDAEIIIEINGESETYEWAGSRESSLVITLEEEEIRFERMIS